MIALTGEAVYDFITWRHSVQLSKDKDKRRKVFFIFGHSTGKKERYTTGVHWWKHNATSSNTVWYSNHENSTESWEHQGNLLTDRTRFALIHVHAGTVCCISKSMLKLFKSVCLAYYLLHAAEPNSKIAKRLSLQLLVCPFCSAANASLQCSQVNNKMVE